METRFSREGENSICEHNRRNRALGALVLPQALLWPAVIGEVREQNVTTTGTPSRSPSTARPRNRAGSQLRTAISRHDSHDNHHDHDHDRPHHDHSLERRHERPRPPRPRPPTTTRRRRHLFFPLILLTLDAWKHTQIEELAEEAGRLASSSLSWGRSCSSSWAPISGTCSVQVPWAQRPQGGSGHS